MKALRTLRRVCGYLVLLSPAIVPAVHMVAKDGVLVLLTLIGGVVVSCAVSGAVVFFGLWIIGKD